VTGNAAVFIIVNPAAGGGRGGRVAWEIAAVLRAAGLNVTIRHTERKGDAERIATEAARTSSDGNTCIAACGGDGTVQEVANSLAGLRASGDAGAVMALAPAGRCNDFARALGVPKDAKGMAETILRGAARPVDLGRVNGRFFCTVATAGADAEITRYVDGMKMPLRGTPAYLYGASCVLSRYRGCRVTLEGDFGTFEQNVFVASTANTALYGGAIRIAPMADPTDGWLDLCVIDLVSKARIITLLPRVLLGRHAGQPEVRFFRTRGFTMRSPQPIQLWADGEPIAQTPALVESVQDAVRIFVPGSEPRTLVRPGHGTSP